MRRRLEGDLGPHSLRAASLIQSFCSLWHRRHRPDLLAPALCILAFLISPICSRVRSSVVAVTDDGMFNEGEMLKTTASGARNLQSHTLCTEMSCFVQGLQQVLLSPPVLHSVFTLHWSAWTFLQVISTSTDQRSAAGSPPDPSNPRSLFFALSKLHVPPSDLQSCFRTADRATADTELVGEGKNEGVGRRRLCCDQECVWHYVNSTYLLLIASAAKTSIINAKETIYCFESLPRPQ